jgi:hypothetical protein
MSNAMQPQGRGRDEGTGVGDSSVTLGGAPRDIESEGSALKRHKLSFIYDLTPRDDPSPKMAGIKARGRAKVPRIPSSVRERSISLSRLRDASAKYSLCRMYLSAILLIDYQTCDTSRTESPLREAGANTARDSEDKSSELLPY